MYQKRIEELNHSQQVTRDMIQDVCLEFRNHPELSVFLNHTPRLGKTRSTLNMLYGEKVLVVSNSTLIRDNWKKTPVTKSICWHVMKDELDEYESIVLDEWDCFDSINNLYMLKNFNPKRWVFLTGTADKASLDAAKEITKYFTWTITTQQAIDWGILPKPKIYAIGIDLNNSIRNCVYEKGKDKNKYNKTVPFNEYNPWERKFNYKVMCTEKEWISLVNKDQDYWIEYLKEMTELKILNSKKRNSDEELRLSELSVKKFPINELIARQKLNVIGNMRKKFFAEQKMSYLIKFINREKLADKRLLIFLNSKEQCDSLDYHGVKATYSAKGKKGEKLIEEFQEGKIKKLSCINQLNRGVDLTNIDLGIILQMANSQNENKQKASRMFLDDLPVIVLFYFKNCKDEDYLEKFCQQFKEEYITKLDYNQF